MQTYWLSINDTNWDQNRTITREKSYFEETGWNSKLCVCVCVPETAYISHHFTLKWWKLKTCLAFNVQQISFFPCRFGFYDYCIRNEQRNESVWQKHKCYALPISIGCNLFDGYNHVVSTVESLGKCNYRKICCISIKRTECHWGRIKMCHSLFPFLSFLFATPSRRSWK